MQSGLRDLGTLVVAMPNEAAHLLAVVATCKVRAVGYRNGLTSTSANFSLCNWWPIVGGHSFTCSNQFQPQDSEALIIDEPSLAAKKTAKGLRGDSGVPDLSGGGAAAVVGG